MSEDRTIIRLARRARERLADGEARYPGTFDELAAGALEPAAAERLRAAGEDSREARVAYEVFRPMGADFQARMVDEIRGLAGSRVESGATADREPAGAVSAPRPQVRPFPAARGRQGWPLAAAAALAAVAFGLWLVPRDGGAPLPRYELVVDGIARERSSSEAPPVATLAAGSSFRVLLSPEVEIEIEVDGAIGARFFAVRDREWRRLDLELETAPTGALRFEGSMTGELVLEPGPWTLVAAVGRLRALPPEAEVRERHAAGEKAPAGGWQLLEVPLRVERRHED